jgi:glycosyltransferase involved in cell wall biosynthesis
MASKKRVLVSVTNDLYTDQRVHKVCTFLEQQGYDVLLIGRLRKNSQPLQRSYQSKRMRLLFDKGAFFYAEYSIRLFFLLLFRKFDVLLSNDLDTLLPNYLVSRLRRKKIVYDSHEYFTEVPELVNRPKIQRFWERIEGFIFPKLNFIYTVNSSIAQKYEEKYGKKVEVVRNISPHWSPVALKSKAELGIPENKFILIFQGAGINIDRGAEEMVEAMKFLENIVLLFVGDGDVVPNLKNYVTENKLDDKVLFFGKRPYQEMMNFTFHADLGLSLDKDSNLNYRFSLPNKIFDYMHTSSPILASGVVEVRKIVEGYKIGKIITSHNPEDLATDIQFIQSNPELYNSWKENCKKAAEIENWEKESEVLQKFFPKYA